MVVDDETAIRRGIETWAIARDTGDWARLASVWHPQGRMVATWFDGPAADFVAACRRASSAGVPVQHVLGGTVVRLGDGRAVAETRMTIHVRTDVEGELCDLACIGRFFDFWEMHQNRWALRQRQLIYEKDRVDPVRPGAPLVLDPAVLDQFPVGYRHLAYQQSKAGLNVNRNLFATGGAPVEPLYHAAAEWLAGLPLSDAAAELLSSK